jgi:Mor family transcriptional regulator
MAQPPVKRGEFRSKGPELLIDLAEHIADALAEMAPVDQPRAAQIGREIAERMAGVWGGQNIYFPMGMSMRLSQRDRQIYDKFTGANHSELAREYGVSIQWIYKIVKAVHREEIAMRQHDLFPGQEC